MAQNYCGLYRPYGAFELKATYQRNLLCGTLAVTALVAAILVVAAVYPRPQMVVIDTGDDLARIDSIVVELTTQPSILYDAPDFPVAEQKAPVDLIGTIPVPVDDALFDDREDVVIPSRMDLALAVGPGVRTDQDLVGGIVDTVGEYFPDINEFVPVEIPVQLIKKYVGPYPRLAERAGLTGQVTVQALIDKDGKVREVRIARSSGVASLDEAARRWAYRCIFSPGIQNKRPIACWVSLWIQVRALISLRLDLVRCPCGGPPD